MPTSDHRIVALVPARGGSTRIPRKNIRLLAGRPLLSYTIAAAKESGIFAGIFVSTEDEEIGRMAVRQGGVCWIKRPPEMAESSSPDIEWLTHALEYETYCAGDFDAFAILRPTSPLRTADTIQRAWAEWLQWGDKVDSLRAVQPVSEPPCKMWQYGQDGVVPRLIPNCQCFEAGRRPVPPHHSRASQSLPRRFIQNASLEIAWVNTVLQQHSISGERVMPFFTDGYEGFDLNQPDDWFYLEFLLKTGQVTLPEIV